MLRLGHVLFACTALSTLLWAACSLDPTHPDPKTGVAPLGVEDSALALDGGFLEDGGEQLSPSKRQQRSWTSADINSIPVWVEVPIQTGDGCVLEAIVDGLPRDVQIALDGATDSFSITSRNARGEVVWLEVYETLGVEGQDLRITEVGQGGFGLRWTRERLGEGLWRESFAAIGLSIADLVIKVDYSSPESVAEGLARFGDWLPTEVSADVFGTFEGMAVRRILASAPKMTALPSAEFSPFGVGGSAGRSVVEKVCIASGICTGIKCLWGGGLANPICEFCGALTVACALCDILGLGC